MRKIILLSITIIIATLGTITICTIYRQLYRPNVKAESYLYIHTKLSPKQLISIIDSSNLLINTTHFKRALSFKKLNQAEPGRYRLSPHMTNLDIIKTVKLGWQTPANITLSGNIRTKERLAELLTKSMRANADSVLQLLQSDSIAKLYGFDVHDIIGMFLPDTYQLYWTAEPINILSRFKKEYDLFWNQKRVQRGSDIGLTPKEITILASIVCEETNLESEYPVIAGVYINRLKMGMPLQADPTVKYAVGDFTLKRVLLKHLTVNSPYNTYKTTGLPPGPITIPNKKSIDSVLDYTKHNYLYFCASSALDGSHLFAKTLAEHNRNAKAYHNAITRLNIR